MSRPLSILLFEDKLGISAGYQSIWNGLLLKTGLTGVNIYRRNSHSVFKNQLMLLTRKGNRIAPGFNESPGTQNILRRWMMTQITATDPTICVCMDPALLFICNPDWNQATLDKLRGGVYRYADRPFVVMLGLSAWHNKKKEKDIARLNEGYTDEEEWEEAHGGDEQDTDGIGSIWLEPVSVPFGKFVLTKDLEKVNRVLRAEAR